MNDIGFAERDRNIAIGMGGPVMSRSVAPFSRNVFSAVMTSDGIAASGDGGKSKSQSSTRCADRRCLWVFAWAMIAAPSALSHPLPSAWSKCQWVLIRCLIGPPPRPLTISNICERETVMPASTNTLPSAPGSTAMLPPEPWRMLSLPRSL